MEFKVADSFASYSVKSTMKAEIIRDDKFDSKMMTFTCITSSATLF